jgi:hypothetical protein
LASRKLRGGRRNKIIPDLVEVRGELRQVHSVGSCVGYVHKEPSWELTLEVEVPLLHIAILGIQVGR